MAARLSLSLSLSFVSYVSGPPGSHPTGSADKPPPPPANERHRPEPIQAGYKCQTLLTAVMDMTVN